MKMLVAAAALAAFVSAEAPMRVKPGDVAPSFSLQASTGQTVSLADFAGKQTVVLAFYPKAFTGG